MKTIFWFFPSGGFLSIQFYSIQLYYWNNFLLRYETHTEAENCISTMKENTLLDGYKLLIDWDAGFKEGRQYTRRKNKKFMLNYPSL